MQVMEAMLEVWEVMEDTLELVWVMEDTAEPVLVMEVWEVMEVMLEQDTRLRNGEIDDLKRKNQNLKA
ncbi:hypothetical protein LSTR_LSTR016979 [Laodelphax striatellus]|uniref:Uncharacterized protein n=1 Tax=Laodelphax striatellus TaxID=195883 RepID=A0A482XJ16_LAOST|nr:hypothetical protein LSTR_LSTR016979 [Laodelphax striatellus]